MGCDPYRNSLKTEKVNPLQSDTNDFVNLTFETTKI